MGAIFSRRVKIIIGATIGKKKRILIGGLDGVGKSTILSKLGSGFITTTMSPFQMESIKLGKAQFLSWDVEGNDENRPGRSYYYQGINGIIFVVDSADRSRMHTSVHQGDAGSTYSAATELKYILEDSNTDSNAVLLVLANKQDSWGAMSIKEVSDALGLHKLPLNRKWSIRGSSSTHELGSKTPKSTDLGESVNWLLKELAVGKK
jgi:GTPase SAR1 family protein